MASPAISPLGTLSYNGVEFGPYTTTTGLRIKPVASQDGRTTIYNLYTFSFRTWITLDPTDATVTQMRRALTKYGADFTFKDRGMGDISVNTGAAGVRDVAWGPKPQELSFNYVAADKACRMEWSIEVAIPDCSAAKYAFAPMEFCYSVNYAIDRNGMTRRTYSGFVRIPLTRKGPGQRTLPDSADAYREKIYPAHIEGYRRIPGDFKLSEDRTRLDFSITDEQMGRFYPPEDIVDVEANFSASANSPALTKWTANLHATYTMTPNTDPAKAIAHFMKLRMSKVQYHQKIVGATGGGVIPLSFSISDQQIYGDTTKIALTTSWMVVAGLEQILRDGGFWKPVPNSNWRRWSASMSKTLGARGVSQLAFDIGDDKIIDLCDTPLKIIDGNRIAELKTTTSLADSLAGRPAPDKSWIEYRCWIEVENDSGTVELRTLPTTTPTPALPQTGGVLDDAKAFILEQFGQALKNVASTPPIIPGGALLPSLPGLSGGTASGSSASNGSISQNALDALAAAGVGRLDNQQQPATLPPAQGRLINDFIPVKNQTPLAVQRRTDPTVYVYLCGYAVRVGWPIPVPELTLLNGEKPVPSNRLDRGEGFKGPRIVGNAGAPIYAARWRLRYVLKSVPAGGIPTPPNPLDGGR